MLDDGWLAAELKTRGLVTDDQIEAALNGPSGDFCLELLRGGALEENTLLHVLGLHFQTQYVPTEKLSQAKVPQWVLDLVPVELCDQLGFVPVRCDRARTVLSIVTPDPADVGVRQVAQNAAGVAQVNAYVALPHAIDAALKKWYRGDIHAFARFEQQEQAQLLDIYDQRLIDLASQAQDEDEPLEIDTTALPPGSGHHSAVSRARRRAPSGSVARPAAAEKTAAEKPATERPVAPPRATPPPGASPSRAAGEAALLGGTVSKDTFAETLAVVINLVERALAWRQGHSSEVGRLVTLMSHRLGLSGDEVSDLRVAAYLHELGKPVDTHPTALNISDSRELKESARRHYLTPLRLLQNTELPQSVKAILATQYERVSGDGVPGQLGGRDIPTGARLIAVADAFCDLGKNPAVRLKSHAAALGRLREAAAAGILDAEAVELLAKVTSSDMLRERLVGNRRRVLIIDSHVDSNELLEPALAAAGYEPRAVKTTAEGAREVLSGNVDLVLSEIELKPVDGLEFVERIRADHRTQDIPLIFVSAVSDPETINRCFELGALDFVAKPFSPQVLVAKVKKVLGPSAGSGQVVSGSLGDIALIEVVQTLFEGQKSGRIQVRSQQKKGAIQLQAGQLVDATCEQLRGEAALVELFRIDTGEFAYDPDLSGGQRVIQRSTAEILAEHGADLAETSS